MTDEERLALAQQTYNQIKNEFDRHGFHYGENQQNLQFSLSFTGEDLPMQFLVTVNAATMRVVFISKLPFTVPADKMAEMAVAISAVNWKLFAGCFEYDIKQQTIYYRMVTSYEGTSVSGDEIYSLLMTSANSIDRYNDTLMMLAKGMITLEKFMDTVKGGN